MMATMICFGFLPFSFRRSPKVFRRGLKTLAFIAGMKRARLRLAEPTFVIGVVGLPEVPLVLHLA